MTRARVWISRTRHHARNFERYDQTAAAFIRLVVIRVMLRLLTRSLIPTPNFLNRLIGHRYS